MSFLASVEGVRPEQIDVENVSVLLQEPPQAQPRIADGRLCSDIMVCTVTLSANKSRATFLELVSHT